MSLTSDEINKIAEKFVILRKKARPGTKSDRDFKEYKNYCISKLAPLVYRKTNKYRKFSNHPDLQQDGFEALMMAFKTYEPEKGSFVWWANKYISTRVSRAANTHSTIRVPLKKAKETQPYKTNVMPVMVDQKNNPLEDVEKAQINDVVMKAIDQLPPQQKKAILMRHDFIGGNKSHSINTISTELKVSRPTCIKLLAQAEEFLVDKLQEIHLDI